MKGKKVKGKWVQRWRPVYQRAVDYFGGDSVCIADDVETLIAERERLADALEGCAKALPVLIEMFKRTGFREHPIAVAQGLMEDASKALQSIPDEHLAISDDDKQRN